jgi:low temperature requirement protein LtrA
MIGARHSQLRGHHEPGHHHRVTFAELFFDLVFVFAITQLSHGLLKHLTPIGAAQTGLLLLAVWWVWVDTTWVTNWLDPDKAAVRIMLFLLMLAGLMLSASIPRAFEDRGLAFALALASMQVGRNLFMLWALRHHDAGNFRNFIRIAVWRGMSSALYILGGLLSGHLRMAAWAAALAVDCLAPVLNFRFPGLGASRTEDWNVEGNHMAERCGLFIILALGESILITGATLTELSWSIAVLAAFTVAFVGSIAMWMIYFNIGAERGSQKISSSQDPGRMARSGYTYLHMPIVAGIIVAAVADDLILHHPGGDTSAATAAVILGGPAIYLAGVGLFKRLSAPYFPLSHLVGLGLLALMIPAVPYVTPLALSAGATATLILVAAWEWMSLRPHAAAPAP